MDEGFKKQLLENGADVETTINRFMGREDLYLNFLFKFQNDKNYESLAKHLETKQYEDAFNDAHTLKGVSANLGLNPIAEASSKMTELLRGKKTPNEINLTEVDSTKEHLGDLCTTFRNFLAMHEAD